MKFLHAAVLLSITAPGAAQTLTRVQNLRRAQGNSNGNKNGNGYGNANGNGNAYGLRKSMVPCTIVLSDIQYADRHEEDLPLECELEGEDLNGKYYKMVKVKGVPPGFAKAKGLESGVSTIYADNSEIDDENGEYIIPEGAEISVGRKSKNGNDVESANRRELVQIGNKKILVLRVVASDAMTTSSEGQLSDSVFGTSGDPVNIKSQYETCSYGQLTWDKVTNNNMIGDDSVYTVSIPNTVIGSDNSVIRDAVTAKAASDLGVALNSIADHVMVCVPPGTTGGWIAYAYVNHWLSVYNDKWCEYLSGQMHEIGHNLGLGHSGETATYDDQSGMMGYSYSQDDGPRMCFNGPKTYQLGWFANYHVDLTANNSFTWTGTLVGFAEKDGATSEDKMIIRIGAASSTIDDYYVHYNRKTGFNSGTVEGGDQILVAHRPKGQGYAASTGVAKLNAGGTFQVNEFNGVGTDNLVITVDNIDNESSPHRATVTITFGNPVPDPTPAPVPDPTTAPVPDPTPAPVPDPTPTPVPNPTPAPVPDPTPAPVPDPTPAPVPDPTPAPVPDPTPAPVPDPTPAPVPDPTPVPVSDPTPAPVPDPTPTPVPDPTPAPVPDPTPAPVPVPTPAPVPNPTPAPLTVPTVSPIGGPSPSCDNDGKCEVGEDCSSCPGDCLGQGNICCVGGECGSWKCNRAIGWQQWICIADGGGSSGGNGKGNGNKNK